uniref:Uncharacterized protein n=1 Tax=Amphimedon queenslandica TaxID=400682 RepID=A0A1X7T876_AMPQE
MASRPSPPPPSRKTEKSESDESEDELQFGFPMFPLPFLPPPFLFRSPRANTENADSGRLQDDEKDKSSPRLGSLPPFLENLRMMHQLAEIHKKMENTNSTGNNAATHGAGNQSKKGNAETQNANPVSGSSANPLPDLESPSIPVPVPLPMFFLTKMMMEAESTNQDGNTEQKSASPDSRSESPPSPPLPPFLQHLLLSAAAHKMMEDEATNETQSSDAKDAADSSAEPLKRSRMSESPPVPPLESLMLLHALQKMKKDDSDKSNDNSPMPSPPLPDFLQRMMLLSTLHEMIEKASDDEDEEETEREQKSATPASHNAKSKFNTESPHTKSNDDSPMPSPPLPNFLQRMMLLSTLREMMEKNSSDNEDKDGPEIEQKSATPASHNAKSKSNTESPHTESKTNKAKKGNKNAGNGHSPMTSPPNLFQHMMLLSALREMVEKDVSDDEDAGASNRNDDHNRNESPPFVRPMASTTSRDSNKDSEETSKPANDTKLRRMGPLEKFICITDYENGESIFRALLSLRLFCSKDLKTIVSSEKNHKANLLHHAAKHGWVFIIDMLIKTHGFDPMSTDSLNQTAVHYAAKLKKDEAFEVLVKKHDCNPMCKNSKGETPLLFAIESGCIKIVEYYMRTQQLACDGNTTYNGKSLGIVAAEHGHLHILKYLIAECNFNVKNSCSEGTALDCAARSGHLHVVKHLISECKCDPNGGYSQKKPIHYASEKGHIDIVKYLAGECKCDVNAKDSYYYGGLTPLEHATINGHFEVVEHFVLECKCEAATVLKSAAKHGHYDILKFLAAKTVTKTHHSSCLNAAIEKKDARIVMYLLALWESDVANPLFTATKNHNLEQVDFLINECHVDPTIRDSQGKTPLHYAVDNLYSESGLRVIQCLLATGQADPLARDSNGDTPLSIAGKSKNKKPIMLFFDKFAKTKSLYPVDSYVNVLILGNSGAGKTTLSKVIEKTARGSFAMGRFRDIDVKDVKLLTAGIVPTKLEHNKLQNIILHDFAGQSEYYASHTAVIENLLQGSAAVIVIVVDVSKNEFLTQLKQWLTVVRNETQKAINDCKVIVVASHIDSLKSADLEEKKKKIEQELQGYCCIECLDCRKLGGDGLDSFFSTLQSACSYIREKDRRCLTLYCHMMYNLLQESEKKVLTLQDIASEAIEKGDRFFLPVRNGKEILHILTSLHTTGLIYYLNCEDDDKEVWTADSTHIHIAPAKIWVVKNKQLFLKDVNGTLFAPEVFAEHRDIAQNGVIPVSSLTKCFPDYDPIMIISFLERMGLCHMLPPLFLMQTNLVKKDQPDLKDFFCLFFPSLVDIERPEDLGEFRFGWFLQCTEEHQFFPQRFFHLLLLSLATTYAVKEACTMAKNELQCTFWKDGIEWSDKNGVSTLVELVDQKQCLLVLMQYCGNELSKRSMVSLRRELIKCIMTVCQNSCLNLKVEAFVIDPNCLQHPIDKPKERTVYSVKNFRNRKEDESVNSTSMIKGKRSTGKPLCEILPFEPDYCNLSIFGKELGQ